MKFSSYAAALFCVATSGVACFSTTPAFSGRVSGTAGVGTALYSSTFGIKEPSFQRFNSKPSSDPSVNPQVYLTEPGTVDVRGVEGTALVSGLVRAADRTDQFMFDLLNVDGGSYSLDNIIAFVDDVAFAKKRLLSRSARYTGLLDKLQFMEANSPGVTPTIEQMENVTNWLAVVEGGDIIASLKDIIVVAKEAPKLENLCVLLADAVDLGAAACDEAIEPLKPSNVQFNILAVGSLTDGKEGETPYSIKNMTSEDGVIAAGQTFSRDEAYRLAGEMLMLESAVGTAISFTEVKDENATEAKLIKGLRAAGYDRTQEIDHMLRDGIAKYQKAIDDYRSGNPLYSGKPVDYWWEAPQFVEMDREMSEKLDKKRQERKKNKRTLEIEKIALEWAKREYFRQSMEGLILEGTSQDAFTDSVWERAMFEGDLRYRQLNGELTEADAEVELEDFKAKEAKQKAAMLKRAKAQLRDILDDADISEEDLETSIEKIRASADEDEEEE